MNKEFYLKCDALLKLLQKEIIMEPSDVAATLGVTIQYARTVVEQLRKDGFAGGVGTGPVSRTDKTYTFTDFYKRKIKEDAIEHRTKIFSICGFWLAVISILWQVLEYLLQSI